MKTQNQLPRVWHVELWVNMHWLQLVSACHCELDGSGLARVGVRSGSLPVKPWQLLLRH